MSWPFVFQHYPLSLAAAVVCAAVGFYSLRRSRGRPERASLARILFLAAVWTSFSFSTSWSDDNATGTLVAQIIYAVAAWVPFAFCRLVLDLLPSPPRAFIWFARWVGVASVVFSITSFHPEFILGVQDVGGMHSVLPGPFFGYFVAHLLLGMGLAFLPLAAGHRSLEGIERNKLKYFTLGFFVAYVGAGLHFHSAFTGREPFPHDLLVLFHAICIFFGLWNPSRDMNELLRRFLAHSLFGALLGLPTGFVLWSLGAGIIVALWTFTVVALAPPLYMKWHTRIFGLVDRFPVLRNKFVRPDVLAREVIIVEEARNVNEWARRVVRAGQEMFGARSASVLLRQEEMESFLIKAGVGLTPGEMGLLSLPFDSPVVKQLESTQQCLLMEPLEALSLRSQRVELDDLRFIHACALAPLFWNGQLYALACLGPKASGEIYNQSDVQAFSNLSRSAQYALAAVLAGQARGQESAFWAHDLYKPFGPKGGLLNVAKALRGDFGPLAGAVRDALSLAAEDAAFVAKNLKNFIDQAGGDPNEFQLSPLTSVYARSQDRFSPLAKEKGIDFKVDRPDKRQLVKCDATLIEYRVIANLMENALRYTPRGGSLNLGYRVEKNTFIGFVEDSGPGIKAEDLPLLFEPRTQLNPAKKGLAGLGLASVKSVMDAHCGRVWVESEVGKGTTFFFSLSSR
ncbi:MAG: GAF domain-containing sensor histidine kinase [Elusimicrobia bacterium]|nr:GAF domain-containing sensor histidine kinase [Elusimicrobiota bacterium]